MICEETQKNFSSYLDDALARETCEAFEAHLDVCPFCRQRLAETRAVVRSLSGLRRPVAPAGLTLAVEDAIMIERAARTAQPHVPLWLVVLRWIEPRVMPYTVGALTSALLFFTLANALRPHMRLLRDLAQAVRQEPVEISVPAPYSNESPSLNPTGDLLRMLNDTSRGGDDDITIVANVFSNGSASLEEVMQPPRNQRMIKEVEDALRRTPAFVPASLDRRPQTMRVVLSLSKVNVREGSF